MWYASGKPFIYPNESQTKNSKKQPRKNSAIKIQTLFQPVRKHPAHHQQMAIFYSKWSSFFFFHCPLFREGCEGSSSRLSRHTSRSSITSIISLGRSPKWFHPRFSMWSVHLDLGRPTGLLPFALASKACLGSLSWGILLTWPNHLSWDLSIRRSNVSMLRDFRIPELRTLLNSVTPSILRKNLISDACTCDRILLVITQDSWP